MYCDSDGFDINVKSKEGNTAVHIAVEVSNYKLKCREIIIVTLNRTVQIYSVQQHTEGEYKIPWGDWGRGLW